MYAGRFAFNDQELNNLTTQKMFNLAITLDLLIHYYCVRLVQKWFIAKNCTLNAVIQPATEGQTTIPHLDACITQRFCSPNGA